ncbi:exonuclease domain-containing protein [Mycolicibacterium sp.]|uniref:exonuclease domain-containing protein n=1 Tax=Mycolicibacterium sp. TaxID=2320850 RepID=UPI00355F8EA9
MANAESHRRVVIDIETTGLTPETDLILEVGAVIVDAQLRRVAHRSVLVTTDETIAWATGVSARHCHGQPVGAAEQMHLHNGLIAHLLRPVEFMAGPVGRVDPHRRIATSYANASQWMCEFLDEHGVTAPVPLTGSSVRSLDGPFLEAHMPQLFSRFTHRTIDASALTELAHFIDPAGLDAVMAAIPTSGHRSIGDCLRSLAIIRRFALHYGIGNLTVDQDR